MIFHKLFKSFSKQKVDEKPPQAPSDNPPKTTTGTQTTPEVETFYTVELPKVEGESSVALGFYSIDDAPNQTKKNDVQIGFYSSEEQHPQSSAYLTSSHMKRSSIEPESMYGTNPIIDRKMSDGYRTTDAIETNLYVYGSEDVATSPNAATGNLYYIADPLGESKKHEPKLDKVNPKTLANFKDKAFLFDKNNIRDWNGETLRILSQFKPGACNFTQENIWGEFSATAHQFQDTATLYAKIIISELGVPYDRKTIKPIDIGGVAGGEKYIYNNILFKFAMDTMITSHPKPYYMYGGFSGPNDRLAMKASKNELKGLEYFVTAHTDGLNVPLFSIIDYKGYRLIAMSVLPIGKGTLKYGSNDSGRTVHKDIPELNEKMQYVGETLKLKAHVTGQGSQKTLIHGPGDIEAHLGKDGRYYVLDYGRVLPPEDPRFRNEPNNRAVFYNLLRPELVRRNEFPLCSDAYTSWNSDTDNEARIKHNDEVTAVTKNLYENIIPAFANHLDSQNIPWELLWDANAKTHDIRTIIEDYIGSNEVHLRGINLRHYGNIRLLSKSENIRKLILCICVARVIKDDLFDRMRTIMRSVQVSSDEPFVQEVVSMFNMILGNSKGSKMYWEDEMKRELQNKYIHCLSDFEQSDDFNLKDYLNLKIVFYELLKISGVKLSRNAKRELLQNPQSYRFVTSDIKSLDARVFSLHLVYFSEANHLYLQVQNGDENGKMESAECLRLLKVSAGKYGQALANCPTCPLLLHNYARTMHTLGTYSAEKKYYENSLKFYKMMREYAPQYTLGLMDFAKSLRDNAKLKENEEEIQQLLKHADEAEELYAKITKAKEELKCW